MSAKNEVRKKIGYVLISTGALILLFSGLTHSGLRFFTIPLGGVIFLVGLVMLTSVSVIDGVPWLTRLISRFAEPVWDGEIVYTDGGAHKIRYEVDRMGRPWFIARDICNAIGTKPPDKGAMNWAGTPLRRRGKDAYFSEDSVQSYLISLALNSDAANRLLVIIRNDALRKLHKRRVEK